MNLLLEAAIKISLVIGIGLLSASLLRRRSAALRHWMLASAIAVALATPLLMRVAPSWTLPVITRDFFTADRGTTKTIKLIVGFPIRHCIIKAQFIPCWNIANCHQTDLAGETKVWIAGMIKAIIRFSLFGGQQIQVFIDLQNTLCKAGHARVKLIFFDNRTSPQGDQLPLMDQLSRKNSTPTFGMFACFTFWIQIGK